MKAFWHRLVAIVRRRRLDRDLDDELAFHLAMREADYRTDGLSADAARAEARRQFGNVTHLKEQTRDMWTFPSLESFRQDIRYALRTLRKSPGFTFVAVFALAVGIGGNTAIFSLVDAIRSRALPYPDPDRLVQLWGNVQRTRVERRGASYPDYLDWRAQSKSFEDIAAVDSQWMTFVGSDEPERIQTEFVAAPYFSLLGVSAARGRTFEAAEDVVAQPAQVVVLSDGFWKRRFGADPQVIGRTLTLCCAARQYTVVGVMPPGFKGLSDTAELWVPFAMYAPPRAMMERGTRGFAALARLKPGVTLASAQNDLDMISRRLEQAYPNTNEKRAVEVSPLDVELFGNLRPALLTLMAAVAFVLLIACANVANLLLARAAARQREMAIRTALGARRGQIVRQLLVESILLACAGGALVAVAGLRLRCAHEGDLKIGGHGTVVPAAGLLLIVPAGGRAVGPRTAVAGLPLVRRIALAGSRAGLLPVLAGGLGDPWLSAEGIAVELGSDGPAVPPRGRRIIVCPANVIVQSRWLRALADSSVQPETLSVDPSMVALVERYNGKTQGDKRAEDGLRPQGERSIYFFDLDNNRVQLTAHALSASTERADPRRSRRGRRRWPAGGCRGWRSRCRGRRRGWGSVRRHSSRRARGRPRRPLR